MRARAGRWGLLLLVGGAIGLALGYFLPDRTDGGPPTPVIVTTTIIPSGTPALPSAVESKRRELLAAAQTGDYEELRPLISDSGPEYTFGDPVEGGPIAYWKEVGRTTGQDPLATLAAILELPYVLSHGYYVWPFAYTAESADDLSPHERELLAPLGPTSQLFPEGIGYLGWRAGIAPDGTWAFYVAGD